MKMKDNTILNNTQSTVQNLTKQQCKQLTHWFSFQSALAGTLTAFITLHHTKGYWGVLAALLTLSNHHNHTQFNEVLKDASKRLLGAFVGIYLALVGHFVMSAVVSDAYFWPFFIVLFVVLFCASLLNYLYDGFRIALVSTILVMFLSISSSESTNLAYQYAIEMLIGVTIAVCITLVLYPLQCFFIQSKLRN